MQIFKPEPDWTTMIAGNFPVGRLPRGALCCGYDQGRCWAGAQGALRPGAQTKAEGGCSGPALPWVLQGRGSCGLSVKLPQRGGPAPRDYTEQRFPTVTQHEFELITWRSLSYEVPPPGACPQPLTSPVS